MQAVEVIQWYLVVAVLGWGLAPLVKALCPSLPDHGASLTRPLALLAVVWPAWFLASTVSLPWFSVTMWAIALGAGIAGWVLAYRRGLITRAWIRALAVTEAVFAGCFLLYIAFRGFAPEILNTEKPMDMAFLNASANATMMPPADPWLAGETINYYYLGYLLFGSVSRLAMVPAAVGYNLALATVFAMSVVVLAGVAFNLVRPRVGMRNGIFAGALAAFFVAVSGNLDSVLSFLQNPAETIASQWNGEYDIGWTSSRVVYDQMEPGAEPVQTINEFPAFSFVLGDLHPHVMALPYVLATLGLAVALVSAPQPATWRSLWPTLPGAGVLAGSLYMLNSWDYPTFLLLTLAAAAFGLRHRLRDVLIGGGIVIGTSLLAWAPFFVGFDPPVAQGPENVLGDLPLVGSILGAIGVVTWDHTTIAEFLRVFGIPFILVVLYLGVLLARNFSAANVTLWVSIGLFVLMGLITQIPLFVVCGVPLAIAVHLLTRDEAPLLERVTLALMALGLLLVIGTEVFYIRDVFDSRMNTLFKIYYQVWAVLGVAAALAVMQLIQFTAERAPQLHRFRLPYAAVAVVVALGLIYPTIAATHWTDRFEEWQGMDGSAFLAEQTPGDLAAIDWLRENASVDDVVLEAPGCSYSPFFPMQTSRISTFSGVPTVIGWPGHERQWRLGDEPLIAEIESRVPDATAMYSEPDSALLDAYEVDYIVVGHFEQQGTDGCPEAGPFPDTGDPQWPGAGWAIAFEEEGTQIYAREGD